MHRIFPSTILLLTATVLATGGIVNAQTTPARVVVVRPQTSDVTQELRLAGSLDPYQRAELYAKVTGYVKEIPVDIGDRVRRGQVLARHRGSRDGAGSGGRAGRGCRRRGEAAQG